MIPLSGSPSPRRDPMSDPKEQREAWILDTYDGEWHWVERDEEAI